MEAQQVVERILADAKAEAQKVKQQADEKEASEQSKLEAQLGEYNKQTKAIARERAEAEKMHILAAARMDISKQLLAEKRKILDEVFEKVRSRVEKMSAEEYSELMTKLMLEAIETGDEEVIVDKDEKRIGGKFISQINSRVDKEGKGKLKLADERQNIGAGFILKRGKIKVNVSLDVLLQQASDELETGLAKELFGD